MSKTAVMAVNSCSEWGVGGRHWSQTNTSGLFESCGASSGLRQPRRGQRSPAVEETGASPSSRSNLAAPSSSRTARCRRSRSARQARRAQASAEQRIARARRRPGRAGGPGSRRGRPRPLGVLGGARPQRSERAWIAEAWTDPSRAQVLSVGRERARASRPGAEVEAEVRRRTASGSTGGDDPRPRPSDAA